MVNERRVGAMALRMLTGSSPQTLGPLPQAPSHPIPQDVQWFDYTHTQCGLTKPYTHGNLVSLPGPLCSRALVMFGSCLIKCAARTGHYSSRYIRIFSSILSFPLSMHTVHTLLSCTISHMLNSFMHGLVLFELYQYSSNHLHLWKKQKISNEHCINKIRIIWIYERQNFQSTVTCESFIS